MTTYTLRRGRAEPPVSPTLDASQRAVVAHRCGPLLVLAGPGTGKTTTMVEAVVDLVEHRGVRPEEVLALTFSRKAAEQLGDRVTARLGRTLGTPLSSTFHSFAYSLVRRYADSEAYAAPLRLLSAPQQDVVLRELLAPTPESVTWPPSMSEALPTRGFAHEVQVLLSRARERGLTGPELSAIGAAAARPEWVAAGRFLEDYLQNLDLQSALDYSDLVVRAVGLAQEPHIRAELRARYRWVFVDEYQDTDPGQVALLRALAGDGRNLVVVGDPDQSIYAFRGADVRGILDFPTEFPTSSGSAAPVLALQATRRFGPALLAASRRIATALPVAGSIPAAAFEAFRAPVPVEGAQGPGRLEVLHLDTARAEMEHIADLLRRAHLEDGLPWSSMAVLVRSGRTSIPPLRRALSAAGVPVEVAADDTPLVTEPAVQPLLDALRVALHLDEDDPQHPDYVDADKAVSLLSSPLGGLDAAEVRAVARALHRRDRTRAPAEDRPARSSAELLRAAVLDPAALADLQGSPAARARRLAELLRRIRRLLDTGASAEEVLWALWSGTRWPDRLRSAATSGGSGSAGAHRDLDAVCALFDEAARAEEQRGHTSATTFLEAIGAQQLPADTLAERGVRGDAVRLLTAHRAKGLEWDLVVVAGVQEGVWPDLRRRSSLLRADELGADGVLPPVETRALLAEERRLFYVACTRPRSRLVVTAVASPDDDGDQPSRFTEELGVDPVLRQGRPRRPLTFDGLVADLRRTAADPKAPPALREAAVTRLATLARTAVAGQPVAASADPARWWGTRARSWAPGPLRDPGQPVTMSASALEALLTCPAKWFLEREAGATSESTTSQGFGKIVHALADRLVKGEVPADLDALMAHVDTVWGRLSFRTPWSSRRDREEIRRALAWLLDWHRGDAREVLATEQRISTQVQIGEEVVHLYGFADRLEIDEAGRVVVVDLKTTKQHPSAEALAENPQLGLYQLAVDHGAVDDLLGRPGRSGGAELVQLRGTSLKSAKVQRQEPQPPGETGLRTAELQLLEAVRRVRGEEFDARAGAHCDFCGFHALCPTKTSGTVLS